MGLQEDGPIEVPYTLWDNQYLSFPELSYEDFQVLSDGSSTVPPSEGHKRRAIQAFYVHLTN